MQHSHPQASDARMRSRRRSSSAKNACPVPMAPPYEVFTQEEWTLIEALRALYEQGLDVLCPVERAHVRFLRWLVETGRLEP